jgi:hypothetical protein
MIEAILWRTTILDMNAVVVMAGQGTRGSRIGYTDDERDAELPWPLPSP